MKYLKLLLSVVFVSIQFLLCAQNQEKDVKMDSKAALQKMSTIYYLINNFYVDTADFENLTEEAIVSILKELDPHSLIFRRKMFRKLTSRWKVALKVLVLRFKYFRIRF